ncbi:PQQ-dependent sugar dehydrogenase [Phreatobacter oligotrophus]|uniref:Glucose/arabinose dehydrogenase n=1 Tax=Phreatobacter oligotrophus TaxID=1122261 RepID=A0A2T4ZJD5_9HYPH|nr:PQQ-dependent sugar dehydrogenase [Phreatobacter oligotrophus]PTM62092.1 glucose/arabinose dehydrogenase [Phreatobacter oligotrophus]
MGGYQLHRRGVITGALALGAAPLVSQTSLAQTIDLATSTFARGLQHPWGLAFLPDGRFLVTERPGRLRLISRDGVVGPPLSGTPAVDATGQGGLLGIALSPSFARDRLVFLSFAEPRGGSTNGTAVFRGRLSASGTALEDGRTIWRQDPPISSRLHFGSRLVFDRTGHLFVTTGERFSQMDQSQNGTNTLGKLVRITAEGAPAGDAGASRGWNPAIHAIGLRNVQGAALHPETGRLWISNHGPRGGDGLYVVRAGANYGWPLISWGTHYDGRPVNGGLRERADLVQPLVHWTPSIAPAGIAFYTGDLMPAFRGNLFVTALAAQTLVRVVLDGETVVRQERLLGDVGQRFRDVQQGPDGALYLLTDSADGAVLRLAPRGA